MYSFVLLLKVKTTNSVKIRKYPLFSITKTAENIDSFNNEHIKYVL